MGVYIYTHVSKSVTEEEWAKVYDESFLLARSFRLAEAVRKPVDGIYTRCIELTCEREIELTSKTWIGWSADGDYDSLRMAESYDVQKNMVTEKDFVPDAADAILSTLAPWGEEKRFSQVYRLWWAKTQGEPYHMYILAIACMIEARLGRKAYVFGDITFGQCKKAVELANQFLEEPIGLPVCCDLENLWKRVSDFPMSEAEKLETFKDLYIGKHEEEYGAFLRSHFSKETCDQYWREVFQNEDLDGLSISFHIKRYLACGFGIKELCSLLPAEPNEQDSAKIIQLILNTDIYAPDTDCEKPIGISPDSEVPYGVGSILASYLFRPLQSRKVERYIPMEIIREELKAGLAGSCDPEFVDQTINDYIISKAREAISAIINESTEPDNEKKLADQLRGKLKDRISEEQRQEQQYDIPSCSTLYYYQRGNSVTPDAEKILHNLAESYEYILKEKTYLDLMQEPPLTRCEWIARSNRTLWLRDKDWERIYSEIRSHEEAFARYYFLVRLDPINTMQKDVVKSLALNKELYEDYLLTPHCT